MKWIVIPLLVFVFSFPVFAGHVIKPIGNTTAYTDQNDPGTSKSKTKEPVPKFDFTQAPPDQSRNSQYLIGKKKQMILYRTFDRNKTPMSWIFLRIGTGD